MYLMTKTIMTLRLSSVSLCLAVNKHWHLALSQSPTCAHVMSTCLYVFSEMLKNGVPVQTPKPPTERPRRKSHRVITIGGRFTTFGSLFATRNCAAIIITDKQRKLDGKAIYILSRTQWARRLSPIWSMKSCCLVLHSFPLLTSCTAHPFLQGSESWHATFLHFSCSRAHYYESLSVHR